MEKFWLVALGGSIGSCMRYLISLWSAEYVGAGFPYGTLLVNVIGSFIIGVFMAAATEKFIMNPNLRFLVVIGFCGECLRDSASPRDHDRLLRRHAYDLPPPLDPRIVQERLFARQRCGGEDRVEPGEQAERSRRRTPPNQASDGRRHPSR